MSTDQYYELEGYINYSLIKKVSTSANLAFIEKEEKKPSIKLQRTFDLGHIIEKYILEDKDISYIKLDRSPDLTGHSLILFKSLLEYCKDNNIKNTKDLKDSVIENITSELGLWSNVKNRGLLWEKAANALNKLDFYLSLKEGDMTAPEDVSGMLSKMDEGINRFDNIRELIKPSDPLIEVINQLPIIIEDKLPLPAKGLLDRVNIDHRNKEIIILDVKSLEGRVETFISSFFMHKYYYQLPFYYRLFRINFPEFDSYKIHLKFLALSKSYPEMPALFVLNDSWVDRAWSGWVNKSGYKIKGINQLITEIKWYLELGGSSIPYDLAMSNNELIIGEDWND